MRAFPFHVPTVLAFSAFLCIAADSLGAVNVPGSVAVEKVDFERHVMGLFSKLGCNSGSCHGSFQGKNGFRLSLFGYDPDKDFVSLTRDTFGRRIDPVNPDNSLLLLKATGQTLHDGGSRFPKDSWQYQLFREWIVAGAARVKGSGQVTSLKVEPTEYAFKGVGERGQLRVTARFADGSEENVTPFCDFRVQDDSVAEVSPTGQVTARRAGDTAVVVIYRGTVQAVRTLVPMTLPAGFQYPATPEVNYIDKHVFAKLRRLNMVPSELSSDSEYLRRIYIDTTGSLPTPDEVKDFLNDRSGDKRAKLVDSLLKHPLHASLWATKFSDITGNNTDALENPQQLKPKRSQMWHDWFASRIAKNTPYDEIVHGVLCATSLDGMKPNEWLSQTKKIDEEIAKGFTSSYSDRKSLDLFWRRQQNVPIEQWGEKTAAAFLGVRLECAQCHKHPTDRWTQADYRAYANLFGQIVFGNANIGSSPEVKKLIDAENAARRQAQTGKNQNQLNIVREVFVGGRVTSLPHPETNLSLPAKALGGPEIAVKSGTDAREALFQWMKSRDNPFFARSFVNRVWAHYFGIGLVDPVDDFSLANPPSNGPLLDALAADFVESGFNIQALERTILLSRTYQLSAIPNKTNSLDRKNFSHAQIRPMMAEVVVDVLNDALAVKETFGPDAPANARMVQVGTSRLNNASLNYVLRIFGRPPRTTACDCERAMDPALPQTLYRMTDQTIQSKLTAGGNRIAKLLQAKASDEEALEHLFLATLTRYPTAVEKEVFAKHKAKEPNRQKLLTDTLWALINTREFILNH
jgi:hypothetical protein